MEHFEVLADCPHCHVEGAMLEVFDQQAPCCHLGVALESRCRFCGLHTEGRVRGPGDPPESVRRAMTEERCPRCATPLDEHSQRRCHHCGLEAFAQVTNPPIPLDTVADVEAALAHWAASDGFDSVEQMLEANFGSASVEDIHANIRAGRRVETSFDVLGYLFAHMGGSGAGGGMPAVEDALPRMGQNVAPEPDNEDWAVAPTARIQLPAGRRPHRRNRALALISVMAADGQIRDSERRFVEHILHEEGLDALRDEEIRVHRPHEVGPVGSIKDREALLEIMVELAHIDHERDETEIRLVRDYGRAWGVDPKRVDTWIAAHEVRSGSRLQRFLIKIRGLLVS